MRQNFTEKQQEYYEKLKDPRWQKKRLEIFNRDDWCCQICFSSENTLVVHHKYYMAKHEPWDYPNNALITLCDSCHKEESSGIELSLEILGKSIRENFLSDDIMEIAQALREIEMPHVRDVTASIIKYAFKDKNIMNELNSRFWKHLEEIRKEKQKDNPE
jgi:hypothetical protein